MFLTRENFGFLHKLPIEIANYGSLNECLESHQRGYERVHYSEKGIHKRRNKRLNDLICFFLKFGSHYSHILTMNGYNFLKNTEVKFYFAMFFRVPKLSTLFGILYKWTYIFLNFWHHFSLSQQTTPLKTHRNFLLEGLVVISNEGSCIVIIVFLWRWAIGGQIYKKSNPFTPEGTSL